MGRKEWDAIHTARRWRAIRGNKVQQLMKIREDWTVEDYEEWETDLSIPYPSGKCISEWRRHMEQVLYHNYDINYIQECIDNEKL